MPHFRKRYLKKLIKKDLSWSRIVSVFGMRQSGKTTLLKQLAGEYLTLDSPEVAISFNKGEWNRLDTSHSPLVIDEAQLCPGLFPQLKIRADEFQKPGQFLLTGSVRFLSRTQIRESLTGRTSLLELLPMTLAETHQRPLHDMILTTMTRKPNELLKTLIKRHWCTPRLADVFLENGGMPGICFKRDSTIRRRSWSSHLDTIFSRDIQLLRATDIPLNSLRDLYTEIARVQGDPVNHAAIARRIGTSSPTLKHLIMAFEGLFLIRRHGSTYFCEDPGLASFAVGGANTLSERANLLRLLFFEFHAQMRYLHDPGSRLSEFRTRGGAHVPLVFNIPRLGLMAIGIDSGVRTSEKTFRSIAAFQKKQPSAHALCIHKGTEFYVSPKNSIPCVPWTSIF